MGVCGRTLLPPHPMSDMREDGRTRDKGEDKMSNISIKRPKRIRKGQQIFNFLEWCRVNKDLGFGQAHRMGDPFFISDELWDEYYAEFLRT